MTALLRYDAACRAIAAAKTIDEVSDWIDKAAAVREYGRRIRNRQIELDALQIRSDAKRKRGQILRELKERGQLREGRKKLSTADDSFPVFTLDDLKVTADESSEDQKIAALDGDSYSRLIARCRAYAEAHPEKHAINVLKPPPDRGPVNGAGAVAQGRKEPPDSLDYSPTPPWGTRALFEIVLPALGVRKVTLPWEPACGDGHMAEVIAEYAPVSASDIHDYGYGDVADFLKCDATETLADWIITNPPFNKGEEFAAQAFRVASKGVAFFTRWQWIEGVGRYNALFHPHPPAMVAVFSERIPLHMGRWEPDGDTMTAYCWIVWLRGFTGATRLFWIPPGQRKALEREGDRDRFTQSPVQKVEHVYCDEAFDPATGEIAESPCPAAPMTAPPDAQARCEPETNHDGHSLPVVEPAPVSLPSPAGAGSSSSDDQLEIPPFLQRNGDGSMRFPDAQAGRAAE